MALTSAERNYDYQVTVGRLQDESAHHRAGVICGILSAYLTFCPEEYIPEEQEGGVYPPPDSLFFEGFEVGAEELKQDYTGEELFIWAHDYEKAFV